MPDPAPQHPSANDCPLCGQPNQCAMAQGQGALDCWCMHASVAPEALATIPTQERGQRCICPVCARSPEGTARPL